MSRLPPQPNNSRLTRWLLRRLPVIVTAGKWSAMQRALFDERQRNHDLSERVYHLQKDYHALVARLYHPPLTSRVAVDVTRDWARNDILRVSQKYDPLNYNVMIPKHEHKLHLSAAGHEAILVSCREIARSGADVLERDAKEQIYRQLQIEE